MADIAELEMNVTSDGVAHAAEEMERLANAAERLANALERLNGQPHGGITFRAFGHLTEMTVAPIQ